MELKFKRGISSNVVPSITSTTGHAVIIIIAVITMIILMSKVM